MEAIILAGGLGTRLKSAVKDVPKPMASINSRPFLEYLLDQLINEGVQRVIFSVGHKSEIIQNHFAGQYRDCEIVYAIEENLLGTGGAIKNAMKHVRTQHVIVVNGDSLFLTNLRRQMEAHISANADVTLALKPMQNIDRYGTVDLNEQNAIIRFNEKQPLEQGLINTGNYIFNVSTFAALNMPEKFSIEKDFFETHLEKLKFLGHQSNGYFLDIGIPADFRRAQYEIGVFPEVNNSWTLFLDRDGVINKKLDGDYVKNRDELELLPGATQAIADLAKIFGKVIIVTNQQGVGKKLMSPETLDQIHDFIIAEVKKLGGRIDAIYYAPQLKSENSMMRKPQIGMALQAKEDFQEIDFTRSIMVGDSPSDMEFAKKAEMKAVKVIDKDLEMANEYSVLSLSQFSKILCGIVLTENQ